MLHRRFFLASLGSAALAAPAMAAPAGAPIHDLPLVTSYIVNMEDQVSAGAVSVPVGEVLALRREPHRAFDANSIAVFLREHRLGYLPANQSKILAHLIDGGFDVSATVAESKIHPRPECRLNLSLTYS